MGVMSTVGMGKVMVSRMAVPYAKRNGLKLAGMAAGLGVAGYSANNARKNGLGVGNGIGMAAGLGAAGFAARGTGLKSMMTMGGRNKIANEMMSHSKDMGSAARNMKASASIMSGAPRNAMREQAVMHRDAMNTTANMANKLRSVPGPRTMYNSAKASMAKGAAQANANIAAEAMTS